MKRPRTDQGIRLLRQTDLSRDIARFLVDREARGLSAGTIEYYAKKLCYLQNYLEGRGVRRIQDVTPNLLRQYIVGLSKRLNPGGVHAVYGAMRAFFRWYESEYEPQGWTNPIRKVEAPRVLQKPLDPLPLADLKAMLSTCQRRTFTGDRDRAILLTLLDTGSRTPERPPIAKQGTSCSFCDGIGRPQ